MSPTHTASWTDANRRYLEARLRTIRAALGDAGTATEPGRPGDVESTLDEAASSMPAPAALDVMCDAFSLSPFERDVLLLCAGVELDASIAAHCAAARDPASCGEPTFGLALAAFPHAHWSALAPSAPLRHWRLIALDPAAPLTRSPLKIDERVLHYLAGISYFDKRLQGSFLPQTPPHELPPSHLLLARRMTRLWSRADADEHPVVHLAGEDPTAKARISAFACAELGLELHVLDALDVPAEPSERETFARLWERETALDRRALLIDLDRSENARSAQAILEQTQGLFCVASTSPLRLRHRPVARLEVQRLGAPEQLRLWRRVLGPDAAGLNGGLERVVAQFDLGQEEIEIAGAHVAADGTEGRDGATRIWDACRANARGRLDDLAQRIEPAASLSDLVLPRPQLHTLHAIAAQVRNRNRVYETWGLAAKGIRGLGISTLFTGVSGTGKTMAAEVLAGQLRLDLYRIDLSQVVSKYIGETEKNLRRVFDAAEAGGAILLFDEADAIFGKRSDVKDSHDRYANIEVSYLLQRMECYRGLAILTTNMKGALDPAFLRRLRFVVQFPFPDATQREEIWRGIYPGDTPVEGLEFPKLARLNVTGGSIRNIALNAAFLAADEGQPVRMEHLLRTAQSECAKLERQVTATEIGGWV